MSPSGSRIIDPMRASTGTVQLSSSYDPSSASRSAYSGYPSSAPYVVTAYDPRYFREGGLEAQRVSSKTYRDAGHSTKLRTEYEVRPRQRSNTTSAADAHLAPGRLHGPRAPPVITTHYRRSPSPLPSHDHHPVHSSSPRRHRRHPLSVSHIDYASDTGRLDPNDRGIMSPIVHSGYREQDPSRRSRYPPTGGLRKGEDIDDYDAYSYTNPREQFEKDSAARIHHDRGSYWRERPLSLTGIDDPQLVSRSGPRSPKPPPSTRGFDRLEWDPRVRRPMQGSADSDVDVASAHRRMGRRNPVHLHQEADEGYSSYRSDYEDAHRHRHRHRRHNSSRSSRQPYDDGASRSSITNEPAPQGTTTGLGTAVLGGVYDDHESQRAERHRSYDHDTRERQNRPQRPSRRRADSDSDEYTSDEDLRKHRREASARPKASRSDDSASGSERPRRRRSHSRHRPQNSPTNKEMIQVDRQEDKRAESTVSKDSETPPKGILKTPTDKFPEEPNPVREGVAPLKDAHKKGIPPGARWTKIDRRLVNPAALEAGRERFEERSDYVIVLRVLSKEEIQAYAVRTQEIRDARYREYVQERRRRREEDKRRGRAVDDFSSDDEEDDDDSPEGVEDKPAEQHKMAEPVKSAG
ncbi:hypothetical protein ANOM_004442 [Aspergillus nomiae NRRL 13137]|uniref:DUF8035 domain-containing protein n=1 Tax=Aspergillus nomiae NRRL (strain ATCC 15546 / NRRL 13137 / CBS 260.88 / M93) TaxID=1509407 RepID=A0A0L1J7U1_ASPN3|nr:uncharacterized protein ANOM_004442 [Aspergillus nomiae NRRL 13137]KNG87755.1 hypothetical protein ANOM_004442 [Aspergillus nomiae NRRL 13137]